MMVAAWGIVVIWVLATIAANTPKAGNVVRRLDILGIVPAWTFFAPNPGVTDPVVFVRDLLDDGTWTPWRIAWRERNQPGRMWWRPGKRTAKLIGDCAGVIPRSHAAGDETLGSAFLLIATIAHHAAHDWRATGFQFLLADVPGWCRGDRVPVAVYRSPLIGLPRAVATPAYPQEVRW